MYTITDKLPGSPPGLPVQRLIAELIAPLDEPVFPGNIPEMNGNKLLFFYCQFCPELGKMGFCNTVLVIDLFNHELAVGPDRYGFPGKLLCLFECGEDRVIFRSIIPLYFCQRHGFPVGNDNKQSHNAQGHHYCGN